MLLSLFAPLGKRSRLSIIFCHGKCSPRRVSTKSIGGRRWTLEENRKLEDLFEQGFSTRGMMNEMKDRSWSSIDNRVVALKKGLALPDEVTGRKTRPWSAEEDALLVEKLEQGLTPTRIASYFPHRSRASVDIHLRRLKLGPTTLRKKSNELPDGRVQRIIDMKLKEAKTFAQIGSELGLSLVQVAHLWRTQCTTTMSKETLDTFRSQRAWTSNEMKHLLELQSRGTLCTRDVALQFPSKTLIAVRIKSSRERVRFPKFSKEPEASFSIKSEKSPEQ
jgi:transposase